MLAVAFGLGFRACAGQTPNLIITVELSGTGAAADMEAVLMPDSTLLLPAADLTRFLSVPAFAGPWVSLVDLSHAYPTVTAQFLPRALRLVLYDPQRVLPVSRSFYSALERQAQGAAPIVSQQSGPFLAFAADDATNTRVDAGYSYRGRFALMASHVRASTSYGVALAPWPGVAATVMGGDHSPVTASGRFAKGPVMCCC